jgi:hypothetical protein
MKSQIFKRLALVATLISLVFVVTNVSAKKPVKEDKPDKTTAECIAFTGDLLGSDAVEGCCPNAGPWPAYEMTLDLRDENGKTFEAPDGQTREGPYNGQLFINGFGTGPNQSYKVQFWSWDSDDDEDIPGVGDVFFEIIGGVIDYDRKSKFLRVSFKDEQPNLWFYDNDWDPEEMCCAIPAPVLPVSFELIRTSDLSNCE